MLQTEFALESAPTTCPNAASVCIPGRCIPGKGRAPCPTCYTSCCPDAFGSSLVFLGCPNEGSYPAGSLATTHPCIDGYHSALGRLAGNCPHCCGGGMTSGSLLPSLSCLSLSVAPGCGRCSQTWNFQLWHHGLCCYGLERPLTQLLVPSPSALAFTAVDSLQTCFLSPSPRVWVSQAAGRCRLLWGVVLLSARLCFIVSSSSRIPVCLLSLVPLGGAAIRLEAEPASPLPGSLAQECPGSPAPMESQPLPTPAITLCRQC